jgi:hypothetical protein
LTVGQVRGFGTERCSLCRTFAAWELYDAVAAAGPDGPARARRFEVVSR